MPSDDLRNYELVKYYNGSKVPTYTGVYKAQSDIPFQIPDYLIPELHTTLLVFKRLRLDNAIKIMIFGYVVSHRELKDPTVNQMEQLDKDIVKEMERYLLMTEEEKRALGWSILSQLNKTQLVFERIK